VNLFLWEKQEYIRTVLAKFQRMKVDMQNEELDSNLWPVAKEYWPQLDANTLIRNLPVLEQTSVENYFMRTRGNQDQGRLQNQKPLDLVRQEMQALCDSFIQRLEIRLLGNEEEIQLGTQISHLTNLKLFHPFASQYGPEPFALRCLETIDMVAACRFTTHLEDVSDDALHRQCNIFLKRLHQFLVDIELSKVDHRSILKNFISQPELFDSIPDLMHCICTCFLLGHNESYVESIGSVVKNHNASNRDITIEHLEEEVCIDWNGPEIQHCDELVKETIDRMHGAGKWHFVRKSHQSKLKFYRVSEAVDNLQSQPSSYFLD
jgi:hypothetical protein